MLVVFNISNNGPGVMSPDPTSMSAMQVLPREKEGFRWKGILYRVEDILYDFDKNQITISAHKIV